MLRRHLDARDILVLRQKIDLLRRRDMQHMDRRMLFAGDAHQPLRAA